MPSRSTSRDAKARQQLALEAARIMRDGGIRDYALAKRKAVESLHLPNATPMPRNQEIEQALAEHQRLFGSMQHSSNLRDLREAAIAAMNELREFQPRLVGPVLSGTADVNSAVTLHLFADSIEDVGWALMERGIDHRNSEYRLKMSASETELVPGFSFIAGEIAIELLIFIDRNRRRMPISKIDGRAMQRASLAQVKILLHEFGPERYDAERD